MPGYVASAMGERHEVAYGAGGDPLMANFDGTAIVSRFPILSSASHRLWRYGVFPTFTLTECTVSLGGGAKVTPIPRRRGSGGGEGHDDGSLPAGAGPRQPSRGGRVEGGGGNGGVEPNSMRRCKSVW